MTDFVWNSRKLLRVMFEMQTAIRLNRSSKKELKLKDKTVSAKLMDLSVGGCGLESPSFLPAGVKLNIFLNREMLAPGDAAAKGKRSKIVGVVKTSRPMGQKKYRLGVQFEKVSAEDARLIRLMVEQQERREDKRITFPPK